MDLADRLYFVANVIDNVYGNKTLSQDQPSVTESKINVPSGMRPTPPPAIVLSDSDDDDSPSSAAAQSQTDSRNWTTSIQQPSASTLAYKNLRQSQEEPLDEPAKKRRREAEELVKSLDRPKTFTCGISYSGDKPEKEFSDNAKQDIRKALPALKTHRHFFHYMVWATVERLKCDHCRLCKNTFKP